MSENIGFAPASERTTSSASSVKSLLAQLTLARAAELARAGRYREAENILSVGGDETESAPAALDLLARVRAQQGHLAEAEKLWMRASQLDPTNAAYPVALRRAAALQQRSRRLVVVFPLLACVALSAVFFIWWLRSQNEKRVHISSTPPAPALANSSLSQPDSSPQPATAAQGAAQTAVQPIENGINVGGVTRTKISGILLLSFDDGLFERNLVLKPDARERLRKLGEQLKPYAATSAVELVGMTDNLPVRPKSQYQDNASLGMERARVVYDFLRFTSGLEPQIFTIRSNVDQQAPAPNDTPANRARNRTVVLRISTR